MEDAYRIAQRTPSSHREHALARIFRRELTQVRIWIRGRSADLNIVSPEARERARAAGVEGELFAAVRKENTEDWARVVEWFGEIDENWERITPEGPIPEPEPDPFLDDF